MTNSQQDVVEATMAAFEAAGRREAVNRSTKSYQEVLGMRHAADQVTIINLDRQLDDARSQIRALRIRVFELQDVIAGRRSPASSWVVKGQELVPCNEESLELARAFATLKVYQANLLDVAREMAAALVQVQKHSVWPAKRFSTWVETFTTVDDALRKARELGVTQ